MANVRDPVGLDELKSELESSYSYLDVLAWAVARTEIHNLVADSRRWSEVIRALCDEHPDLLGGVWFSERGYSEQLEDFFRVMARAGVFSFANPRYERIEITPEVRESVIAHVPEALRPYEDEVDAIANRLKEQLADTS